MGLNNDMSLQLRCFWEALAAESSGLKVTAGELLRASLPTHKMMLGGENSELRGARPRGMRR